MKEPEFNFGEGHFKSIEMALYSLELKVIY